MARAVGKSANRAELPKKGYGVARRRPQSARGRAARGKLAQQPLAHPPLPLPSLPADALAPAAAANFGSRLAARGPGCAGRQGAAHGAR